MKQKETLGELHQDTLKSMDILRVSYFFKGEIDKSTHLLGCLLKSQRTILGDTHADTIKSAYELGYCYYLIYCQAKGFLV